MSFELDFGCISQAGRKEVNEDFAALVEGRGRDQARGAIAAIADGVSAGGNGREAAQTTVRTLLSTTSPRPKPGTRPWRWTASSAPTTPGWPR